MKKALLLLFLMLASLQTERLHAEDSCCTTGMNFYAKFLGGANFLQSSTANGNNASYKTGYLLSGSLGYCWRHYGLCLEAEYAFRNNGISQINFVTEGSSRNGYFKTSSVMGNLIWDLCAWGFPRWKIQPFIGAGAGYDFQKMHASNSRIEFEQKWNHFAWQAIAGLGYQLSRRLELTVEYRFHQGGSDFNNQAVGASLAYKFGFIGGKN
jgi:outer membrane autotransporter protein